MPRPGVWAVAVGAVLRHAAGLGGKRDQRALRGLHLCQSAAGVAHPIAVGILRPADREASPAERIVAAGVEDDDVEPGAGAFHLAQHQVGVEHLEVDVRLLGRVGIDRNEVVLAAHLHPMARVVEQADIGPRQLRPEGLHRPIECRLVEIQLRPPAHEREAQRPQGLGQKLGVVGRIIQPPDISIARIADHERDALVGGRGGRKQAREQDQQRNQERQSTH
jgi:hypothetical protein